MISTGQRRLLLLSVGYGQGHHSAAAALAEHYTALGWDTRQVDICEKTQPALFGVTQRFYDFCVQRAPWMWGITYSLTGTADWAYMVRLPLMRRVLKGLEAELEEYRPDLIICTYPLFAYMLDELKARHKTVPPYAVVVTDALEISRPWMRSKAALVLLPDEASLQRMQERYALPEEGVAAAGFPVRRAFVPYEDRVAPDEASFRVVYGAYRRTGGVINDVEALLAEYPQMQLTVIAGARVHRFRRYFERYGESGRVRIISSTPCMHELLAQSHLYIGKAGAATLFECYATHVPVLVNFTLPGQEQGNLELLLQDGAGCHVESTAHLMATIKSLLRNHAAGWCALSQRMKSLHRADGAARIAHEIERRLGV